MAKNMTWMNKPILDTAHVHDLESRAAIHEFKHGLSRDRAEDKAYQEYVQEHRRSAAAHHLDGIKAAEAVGDREAAQKHWLMYDVHMRALGLNPTEPVPAEIKSLQNLDDKKSVYRFRPHKSDIYAFPMEKAERQCSWRLGERRCKNSGTRKVGNYWLCHHHEEHRQMKKSVENSIQELCQAFPDVLTEDNLQKAELAKVAPPGFSEETMHELKRKHGVESAFKIAWAAYKKKKGKK